jgi:beta-glucosidase
MLNRRELIGAGAAILASSVPARSQSVPRAFPQGFLWGAATAGHQVEGQNTNSDIWTLEHVTPSIFRESSGDACDSFNRWPDDMDIVRALGLNSYRFSLEWARIEPSEGEFSASMMDHYRSMVIGCRDRGLVPVVTFNHFASPRWFAARGGWEVPGSVALFARFCDRAARAMAADMGYATTLNEPNILRLLHWLRLPFPPGMQAAEHAMLQEAARQCGCTLFSAANSGNADIMLPNLLAGHKAGYDAIKSVNPSLPVGVSISMTDDQAMGDPAVRDAKRRDCYGPWMEMVAAHADFLGVQNYSRARFDSRGQLPPPDGAEIGQQGEEVYPASLEGAIRYGHVATGKPILVTENGVATLDDRVRARYIPAAIAGVQRAMGDNIPVLGYVHWSLLDNFEWIFGYGPKLGLCSVDRATQKRTPKPSAHVYGGIARNNGLT